MKNGGPPLFRKSFYKVFFFFRGEGEIVTPMLSQSIFILFFDSTSENISEKKTIRNMQILPLFVIVHNAIRFPSST